MPASNREWWERKLDGNKRRDRLADESLAVAGWVAVRIWEHEDVVEAADRVERTFHDRVRAARDGTSH
jgi:DNA mismatch endonuclease (patch repair protein)